MRMHMKSPAALIAVALSAVLVTGCGSSDTADTASTSETRTAAADPASADGKGRYAAVDGGQLYYEIHGTGKPLILLHGGLATAEATFGAMVPALSANRQVILVELQAHGHTRDFGRPMGYESMADDVAQLIAHLNLGKADVAGYSLGGGVALQLAARNPDLVNRLALISSPYRSDGWMPETRAGMAAMNPDAMRETPMYQLYTAVAPDASGWTALVTKTRDLLGKDYDWTAQAAKIQAPALVVTAESDALYREHAVDTAARIGDGKSARLEIVPGTTHYDIMYRADLLLPLLTPFLDATT
ncbi:alpha/beta fold hydrolase [Nocardia huaxiensis]|uniref:Alpha/beta hydrolase n=1 Tax=Nocardia huaxiensis TaxID=2755382 RepID=A0A7D6ZQ81_9NOCA|nr:alpha/beta hydrolase [Nocardia huaxiensis]QLY32683.1 alpha/beta hydrolase [Nocardia huaxiensis]UFS93582.1 alpha/beta hydrolase [Nocardia huaxiensis]